MKSSISVTESFNGYNDLIFHIIEKSHEHVLIEQTELTLYIANPISVG